MKSEIISNSKNLDILEFLHVGDFKRVIELINLSKNREKSFLKFLKKRNEPSFSLKILESCLNEELTPSGYAKIQNIPFNEDFLPELNELFRILLVLEDYQKASKKEELISLTLLHIIEDGVNYISKNSNNYPNNSINAKIWMDGAGLRSRANELADYYSRKNNDQRELEAIFLRAKLTNTIMNHYPNMVGPDMIAIAHQHEKMGNKEKAKQFYDPVLMDFKPLVQEIEKGINDPETGTTNEDLPITQSLIYALEGLKRIGHAIDEKTLKNAKEIMENLKKNH